MCEICNGYYPNCPVCSDEKEPDECSECKGDGYIYFNLLTEKVCSKSEYDDLSQCDRERETCSECNGNGIIN